MRSRQQAIAIRLSLREVQVEFYHGVTEILDFSVSPWLAPCSGFAGKLGLHDHLDRFLSSFVAVGERDGLLIILIGETMGNKALRGV